jgi:hypothetical protein
MTTSSILFVFISGRRDVRRRSQDDNEAGADESAVGAYIDATYSNDRRKTEEMEKMATSRSGKGVVVVAVAAAGTAAAERIMYRSILTASMVEPSAIRLGGMRHSQCRYRGDDDTTLTTGCDDDAGGGGSGGEEDIIVKNYF